MEKQNLPKLTDLHHEVGEAFKNDDLNLLLNQEPVKNWLKQHPMVTVTNPDGTKRPAVYLPIEKVEFLLTRIFQRWRVEVKDYRQMFNSVAVCVRVHYLNPVNNEWEYHDGLGAVDIQTKSGASPSELDKIVHSAVMKALPAAKSYAIKDAAEHLGKLFGKDLNRNDAINFTMGYRQTNGDTDYEMIRSQLDLLTTLTEMEKYWDQMPDLHGDKKIQGMFNEIKNKLSKK